MILRRYGTFAGGIDLPELKRATLGRAIVAAGRPDRLRVPLAPCGGPPARLTVPPGQPVTAGQKIAVAAEGACCVDIFSPLSGKIGERTVVEIITAWGRYPSPAVELTDPGPVEPILSLAPLFDWRSADGPSLAGRIAEGGLTTARPRIEPLGRWARRARDKRCRTLIANVVEAQPYVTADHRLLAEQGTEVIRGLAILSAAVGASRTILAVDRRRIGAYRRLEEAARANRVSTIALPPKYPMGNDVIAVKVLAGREVPLGGESLDVRVGVTDASTCLAVYRWVACGVPQTGRVVTASGSGPGAKGNFYVPFGTACEFLTGGAAGRRVHGGAMSGHPLGAEAVVAAGTDAVLVLADDSPPPAPTPCIRCGWCTDHCPARLNVAALNDVYELAQVERANRLGAAACVECGVCTYVCPARLPLSQRVKQLKRMLRALHRRTPLFSGSP